MAIADDSAAPAVTLNSQVSSSGESEGGWPGFEDDDRQDSSPQAHSRDRRSCATPPTMCRCRRSPIVPRIGVAAYRLSRARDRSITDKFRFTYVRYAHAARTDVDVGLGDVGLLYARAHTHREPRVDTVDETRARARA